MLIYGAILGGMENIGMKAALELNEMINEATFRKYPSLVTFLESYSAMDVHVMVRFGRWSEILCLDFPVDESLMLYRTASILYGRALAWAMCGNFDEAKKEADRFDTLLHSHPEASERVLYNNSVASLLVVDGTMIRGEIAYKEGRYEEGLELLKQAVDLQDKLNYDEPWGKMQPIRHALGGFLLEQGKLEAAEVVFREDLKLHPRNPWALVGLIGCLERKSGTSSCCTKKTPGVESKEVAELKDLLQAQRQTQWADFDVLVACECCVHPDV
jgi:tetratricopeptide (TPR) repeat protein